MQRFRLIRVKFFLFSVIYFLSVDLDSKKEIAEHFHVRRFGNPTIILLGFFIFLKLLRNDRLMISAPARQLRTVFATVISKIGDLLKNLAHLFFPPFFFSCCRHYSRKVLFCGTLFLKCKKNYSKRNFYTLNRVYSTVL